MATTEPKLIYSCFEDGCGLEIAAPDENTLIATVAQHMTDAHNTFELEEVILANAYNRAE